MNPPIYKNVKQPKGSKVCTACVAAIVTGTTLKQAESAMKRTELPGGTYFYRTREMLKYVGSFGILVGAWFSVNGKAEKNLKLSMYPLPITECTAIMVVKSTIYKNAQHMVAWDGAFILDPLCDEPQSISDYHIIEIYPLTYLQETDWTEEDLMVMQERL